MLRVDSPFRSLCLRIVPALLCVLPVVSPLRSQEVAPFAVQLTDGNQPTGAFSPNGDGLRDSIGVRLTGVPEGLREPGDWRVEIQNGTGEIIRTYAADRRKIRPGRALDNLFLPDSEASRPLRLFDTIVWDGRDENGAVVSDGIYQVLVSVEDPQKGVLLTAGAVPVLVDTEPPELDLSPEVSLLYREPGSPVSGSALERLQIRQSGRGNPGTTYLASVLGPDGRVVRERTWEDPLPENIYISWDEIQTEDEVEQYGAYRYVMTATDPAGNRSVAEVADLLLASFPTRLDLRAESAAAYYFSPNGDGFRDVLSLRPVYLTPAGGEMRRSTRNMREYSFEIFPENSEPGEPPIYREDGSGAPPAELTWDGRDGSGEPASYGRYFVRLSVTDGEEVLRTLRKPVWIDTVPPDGSLSIGGSSFTPDGDGDDERNRLALSLADGAAGVEDWSLRILLAPRTGDAKIDPSGGFQRVYRTWRGGRFAPQTIVWDGTADDGRPCESLERFFVEYEIRDRAGNVRRGRSGEMRTGVLLRPLRRGSADLVARLPQQNYFNERGRLTAAGEDALDAVLSSLSRYGRYNVVVESHSAVPGREEENLEKTEFRARSIFEYVLARGFPRERLRYRGHGEAEIRLPAPVDGDHAFEHYRNERIEVRLHLREAKSSER